MSFCSCQVLSDTNLRLSPTDPASSLPAAKQDLATLLALKTNKKYQPIRAEVELTCDVVTDQSKCLRDIMVLLGSLRERFYPEVEFLSVIADQSKQ